MAKQKKHHYVLVFTNQGPKYVTSVDRANDWCYWDGEKEPHEFAAKKFALETAYGLSLNGNPAVAVETEWSAKQPYRYWEGHLEWKLDEKKNEKEA